MSQLTVAPERLSLELQYSCVFYTAVNSIAFFGRLDMKMKNLLANSAFAALAVGTMMIAATPAQAQAGDTCDLNGTDGGNNAADANNGASAEAGTSSDGSLACGRGARVLGRSNIAIGSSAFTLNGSNEAVAIGTVAISGERGVAVGFDAFATDPGYIPVGRSSFPLASAVAIGARSLATGANTVAIGSDSTAGTGFDFFDPLSLASEGRNITVVGGSAGANQNDATAIGAESKVSGEGGTALGSGTFVGHAGGVAIGAFSQALFSSNDNPFRASVAVGYGATAFDNSLALGTSALAGIFSFTGFPPPQANSALAAGSAAISNGENTVAVGSSARAGKFAILSDGSLEGAPGTNITAIGGNATADENGATAIGALSQVSGEGGVAVGSQSSVTATGGTALGTNAVVSGANSVALGSGAQASALNAVAIGAGSIADQDNTVSVGAAGAERRIVNVAAGIDATDAVNVGQLNSAIGGVSSAAASAQTTANTALANAAAAQTSANTALAQNTVQDGRLTTVENINTVQAGQINAIQALNTTQDNRITAAELVNGQQGARITSLEALTFDLGMQMDENRRQADGGIATAMAMGGMMVVPDSAVSLNFNISTYRGEQGFAGGIVARVAPQVYVNGGIAGSTVKGSTGGRVGVAIGF